MKKQLLSLALLSAAWLACGSAQAWDEPSQVDGVYQIGTASELKWFADYVNSASEGNTAMLNAKAVLTADIDLEGITHTPIGKNTTFKFDGEFDGQHHRIKNMIINNELDNQGFFGCVRGNAIIKNIIIDKSCSITAGNRAAGLIGTLQTAADAKCRILNCVNEADVTSVGGVASGIVGAGQEGYAYFKIHNCVNTGKITGKSDNKAAAFNGWGGNSGKGNSQVWNCYNLGELSPLDGNNTFFCGSFRSVQNCFDAVTTVYQNGVSAISAEDVANGRLCYLLNQGETEGISFKQTIGVDPYPMPVADGDVVYEVADYYCDGTPKGGVTYSNTDGGSRDAHVFDTTTGICTVCGAVDENFISVEADGYYHLKTVKDVEWFSAMVNKQFHGAINGKLDNDIDFEGVANAHQPIGTSAHKFGGKFDGQGYRIKNMVITSDIVMENRAYDGVGFFGSVRGGISDGGGWGTSNTDVVIENLIIDSSCSITYDNHWAAGIVGHINSKQDGGSVTIRNCGNEANISAVENANAGIVGIVESTALPLNIIGCWNTGNITSTGKNVAGIFGGNSGSQATITIKNCWNEGDIVGTNENAAISGWIGDNSGNDVTGCYNIGSVTGLEGTKSLYRGTATTGKNNCDVQAGVQEGKASLITAQMVESGELCYLLNGDQSDIQWTQTLDGTQPKPLPDATGDQVYVHGQIYCTGESAPGTFYDNNGPDGAVYLPHNINDEIGMCDVCYTQFQAPALVDGYYEIKNAGNLEWFSHKVDEGGDANLQINGKLMNDIDMLGIENLHLPIGVNTGKKYNGTFDGQGFRIKNMIIERPTDSNIGFFGFLRGNAVNTTVKNLIMDKSCTIHGYNRVGGITGSCQNNGALITLENIINEATVIAENQDAAGIIGGQEGNGPKWLIKNVLNLGTVTAKNEAPYAGALCCYLGGNGESVIENFVNLGTINGHRGGNIGRIAGTHTNIIDLSDTDPEGTNPAGDNSSGNIGFDTGLTKADIANGKLAWYINSKDNQAADAFFQRLGTGGEAYPSPFGAAGVLYLGETGYTTMYDTKNNWSLSADAQAYIGKVSGSYLSLVGIDDVPKGTAVVINGTPNTYSNKEFVATATADVTGNALKGSDGSDTDKGDGSTIFALANGDNGVGFYLVGDGVVIPAGKAYLIDTTGSSVKGFTFVFDDDATGIEDIKDIKDFKDSKVIYNVAGQRISKMQKGINIVNGKKVMVK